MRLQRCFVIASLVLCAACGESTDVEEVPPTARETVFDPLTDSLERAQGVEDTLRQAAEERRRQLEEAEN